jgi:hypothetical protein
MKSTPFWLDGVLLLAAAAAVAAAAPAPWWETDRDVYERLAREWFVTDCNDFHCFRPLVSWVLGRIPGPELVVWKSYAVLCQVGAGISMAYWVMRQGASRRTARQIAWLTALGSGACYTLFDPHTSDPLMHLLGPLIMIAVVRQQFAAATATSAVAVLAKEFAAVPLMVAAAWRALQSRWPEARRLAAGAAITVAVWAAWQSYARWMYFYTTGPTYSADLTTGSYLVYWLLTLDTGLAMTLIVMVLGGVWLLWGAGLWWGSRELRQLTFAALPAILIFNALQQPDRALWNFAFIVMPAVAVVLDRVPSLWSWPFVAAQTLLNIRLGTHLPQLPQARITFAVAVVLAAVLIWRARHGTPATAVAA